MPHQCTSCGRVFDDGSKEMLSGCPDCGGNKFQFHPSGTDVPEEPDTAAEPPDPPTPDSSVARTVGSAAATVRDFVGRGSGDTEPGGPPEESGIDPTPAPDTGVDAEPTPDPDFAEDAAQADARSQVVSPDEIPAGQDWSATEDPDPSTPSPEADTVPADPGSDERPPEDRPDLKQLREELNDQFESIKVLKPGTYELNLMELYDREEYIIALQEDGRYTIQVPETWHD
jgi:predicted  nucleic acid-binding Zn-ribbon protein